MANNGQRLLTKPSIAYREEAQPVHVVYDTWTPRPHFILVQEEPKSDATANELQVAFEITGRFLLANPQFADNAILSFHRGQWYQQHTSKWHAHLCVPRQAYLDKAREKIVDIPKNKEWRGARTVAEGMSNWHQQKIASCARYQSKCIGNKFPNRTSVESVTLSAFNSPSNEFVFVWLSSSPRIGIVARSPAQSSLASLYKFMADSRVAFEKALSRCDEAFANFGCHLCLYVRDQASTSVTCRPDRVLTENGVLDEIPHIVGYIQMDESQYLQWLPHDVREIWLNEFGRTEHFVRT